MNNFTFWSIHQVGVYKCRKIFTLTQKFTFKYPIHPTYSTRPSFTKCVNKFPPLVDQMALISTRTFEVAIQCLYFSYGWLQHKTWCSNWNHIKPTSLLVSVQFTIMYKIYFNHTYNTLIRYYTVKKAWKALHFIMRILKRGNSSTKSLAYTSLVLRVGICTGRDKFTR